MTSISSAPTGKQVHTMVAHLDAVTSLAVDPNGLYLLSGSMINISFHTVQRSILGIPPTPPPPLSLLAKCRLLANEKERWLVQCIIFNDTLLFF